MDLTPFTNASSQVQALVVYKKSRFELMSGHLRASHPHLDALKGSHDAHQRCLDQLCALLSARSISYRLCFRDELSADATKGHLVFTVGGDGTVLTASHHITDSPLLGINSDPANSVGALCASDSSHMEEILDAICEARMPWLDVTRLGMRLNGQAVATPALNELLIAHQNPAVLSRYALSLGGDLEPQRSSGIWVSAPAGSTGAMASSGGQVQALDDNRLQFLVREPYFGNVEAPLLCSGFIESAQVLQVQSRMSAGMIFLDGGASSFPFADGTVVEVYQHPHPLRLWVTKALLERREAIGRQHGALKRPEGRRHD